MIQSHRFIAVSYTHLDVYKRQVYIASITPACATVTSMAQLYDKDAAYASSLYVLTTLLSIVTMPVMVGMYETVSYTHLIPIEQISDIKCEEW